MIYRLTDNYRVDFTAYAPLHRFKGWCVEGLEAELDMDFDNNTLTRMEARADVRRFTTGDPDRNRSMFDYMDTRSHPDSAIHMAELLAFDRRDETSARVSIQAILEFMGRKRQFPMSLTLKRENGALHVETAFKWSFSAYGLKAPRLLFLAVRDIVDIDGRAEFMLASPKEIL